MANISRKERKTARAMDRDGKDWLSRALIESRGLGSQYASKVLTNFESGKRGKAVVSGTAKIWKDFNRLLNHAMAVQHLLGMKRIRLIAKADRSIALSVDEYADRATAFLKASAELAAEEALQLVTKYDKYAVGTVKTARTISEKRILNAVKRIQQRSLHLKEGKKILARVLPRKTKAHVLESTLRTNLQLSYAAGQQQLLRTEEADEILWGFKYVTVGDSRVRPTHRALEGTTLPKDNPFWKRHTPPNGFNCRCTVIPIFESRPIQRPPTKRIKVGGRKLKPGADKGFEFNPGDVFKDLVA